MRKARSARGYSAIRPDHPNWRDGGGHSGTRDCASNLRGDRFAGLKDPGLERPIARTIHEWSGLAQ